MNLRFRHAIVVALVLGATACATTYDATHLGVPVTMAEPAQNAGTGTAFSITKHPVFVLMGLVSVEHPNIEDLLAGQLGGGSSIANLRIYERARFTDVLVTFFTLGIVSPRSVTFEGVVVGH